MVNNSSAQVDRVFEALADPTRRALLDLLISGESRVKELAAPFTMSMPAISKHLSVLEGAGLIARRVVGRETYCSIRAGNMQEAVSWMERYREFWTDRLDALDAFLQSNTEETG